MKPDVKDRYTFACEVRSAGRSDAVFVDAETAGRSDAECADAETAGRRNAECADAETAGRRNAECADGEAAGRGSTEYTDAEAVGLGFAAEKIADEGWKSVYEISLINKTAQEFHGIVHVKLLADVREPEFFMPGYMYNRNTADMPSSGRKSFPRIKRGGSRMPESEFFMTRSDRLAEPVSLIYGDGHVLGISGDPYMCGADSRSMSQQPGDSWSMSQQQNNNTSQVEFCGFSCNINDNGRASVGYTLGYENAPWLFVQTATVVERRGIDETGVWTLKAGEEYRFRVTVYDYEAKDERAIYRAIGDVYRKYHEEPRKIDGMTPMKAVELLSGAVRDYAWLDAEKIYTGFVFDRSEGLEHSSTQTVSETSRREGLEYNRIPSVSWTNGLAVAVPMLLAANELGDTEARRQSLIFIDKTVRTGVNEASGFLYESEDDGKPTVRGWWYDGMHSGGHSGYINGQAVYYLLKAYRDESEKRRTVHGDWLELAASIVKRMNEVMNADHEYPFAMSEHTGAGIEYDSMGGAWCLAASAMYELVGDDRKYVKTLLKSEAHYYEKFVKRVECYGGPLDTDKAVDDEGILAYIRAARLLHEITGEEYLLDHLRDALCYEFTFKLGYNTPVQIRPLSVIGWSSCGGSITSTANPHIHPMSSTVVSEMKYYLSRREDGYVRSRMQDTIGWSMQTFNTYDGEYGYGRIGWMSERFCFCEGLVTEKYPDGEPASTWFALMPWASASVVEGLIEA